MPTDEPGPVSGAVRELRKRLAKRRTEKKARQLKRQKRKQNSELRKTKRELGKLADETGVRDRARQLGSGAKRAIDSADQAAQNLAETQRRERRRDADRFRDMGGEFADDPAELTSVGPPISDPDAERRDANPPVDTFLDRDPRGNDRDTGTDRALGPFDIF